MSGVRVKHNPPANEADFERLCLALLKVYWDCPGLDLYAHRGEEQFGIDILDLSAKEPLSAAQCKLHEMWKTIPPAEIRSEVQKAKTYSQKIGRYAILTTAKASRAAHDAVLEINQEHRKQGLFQVELMTWGKIEHLLDEHDNIREEFSSTISGRTTTEIREKLSVIHEAVVSKNLVSGAVTQEAAPIPKADAHRFAVALTHLTHDDRHQLERLIIESLRDVPGVQILRFDRTISIDGPVPEASEREAHERARVFLHESSADVLIWGTVLSHDGRTAPRLYWTTAGSGTRSRQPYIPENFQLPEMFWDDLIAVLKLLVVTQSAELFARRGQHIGRELAPFTEKVRNLLETSQSSQRWTPEATVVVMFIFAMALERLGEQTGRRDYLTQAIGYYRDIISKWRQSDLPTYWNAAENNLGVTLGRLGTLESDSIHLMEALRVFRNVLKRITSRESLPLDWAAAQNNLGNVLLILGMRESGTERLYEAAEAYRAALQEWTRERFPLDWATAQSNLGYALHIAGSRDNRTDLLLSAIAAYRNALEEWKRDQVPMYWARVQNNMGNALKTLGERQPEVELFEAAVRAYRFALEERAFEQEPLAWAEAQNNLGAALGAIAERNGDSKGFGDAIRAYRQALKVRTRKVSPMDFASSQNNLGHALVRFGEYTNEVRYFQEAVEVLRDALQVWNRENAPSCWAVAQHNLGDALTSLGRKENSLARLDEAKAAYHQALDERHREREPLLWAASQAALGLVHNFQGEMESGTESLENAVHHYKLALEEYRPETAPFVRAGAQFNLGNVLRLLGQRKADFTMICSALENHAAACQDCLRHNPYWAFRAAEAVDKDIEILKAVTGPHQAILTKHIWISALRSKHAGHDIALAPLFKCVVPGKSGTSQPDFNSVPNKGDVVKDGTVVWENDGKYSYCRNCKEFLVPPNTRAALGS